MSSGKTNITSTQFAAKKLLGKAHTSNLKADVNEVIPSNVSLPSEGVFAEAIPNVPSHTPYTLSSASVGGPSTVEKVHFDVVSLSDTIYDANVSGGGGDESSTSGAHGYYLKLPTNYVTTSSNPNAGTGSFTNGKRVYDSRGALQLVPPLVSNGTSSVTYVNPYILKLYKGAIDDAGTNEITFADNIDWQVDYYSGVIFIQDYNSSKVPVSASAYLYVGKYLNDKISDLSASVGGSNLRVKDEGSSLTTAASSLNFVGANVTATTVANDVTVTLSTPVTDLKQKAENRIVTIGATTSELEGEANLTFDGNLLAANCGIIHKRVSKNTHYTITTNDYFIGTSATASIKLTLPSANSCQNGQVWSIKDEAGNAQTHNVEISCSGGDVIDGVGAISLQSAYAAVNIYTTGSDKFFVY